MNRFLGVFLLTAVLVGGFGCKKTEAEKQAQAEELQTNNAATRYATDLRSDVGRAQVAVDKMNKSIESTQKTYSETQ